MKPSLSIVIICKNEAHDIDACLSSVAWADEIVVLDSESSDETLYIAQKYTSNIHSNADWQGFGVQKNRVLALATSDWVLSIDADERVSDVQRLEIQQAIKGLNHSMVSGYALRGLILIMTVSCLFNSLLLDTGEGKFYCVIAGVLLRAYQRDEK